MNFDFVLENILLLAPLIVIEFSLVIFCIFKIFRQGTANLNKWAWLGIVVVGSLVGSIIFLLVGRRRDF